MLERLGARGTHLTIDWYYRDLGHLSVPERDAINFDHPDSLEVELFVAHLAQLRAGRSIDAPIYDFATHTRTDKVLSIAPAEVIVSEGIHLLGLDEVTALCDLCVFIDVPAELRLERRIRRDVVERGRTEESVRAQWAKTVSPMHEALVQPSIANADVIVAADADLDQVAIELISQL